MDDYAWDIEELVMRTRRAVVTREFVKKLQEIGVSRHVAERVVEWSIGRALRNYRTDHSKGCVN